MAFTMQPPPTFPPAEKPRADAVADPDLVASLVSRKRRLVDKLEELPQCRPAEKVPRGMDRLVERYFARRDATGAAKASGAGAAAALSAASNGTAAAPKPPSGSAAVPWDKGWSFEIAELRTRTPKPKSRALKRKDAAAKVLRKLRDKGDDDAEDEGDGDVDGERRADGAGEGQGEDEFDDETLADDEEEEEEPGDYTNSYFDNGEDDIEENEAERDDE